MISFDWALWHINHCRLFNAKSSLYIQCTTKVSTPLTFLQIFKYISSWDNTDKMTLWYNEKCAAYKTELIILFIINLFSHQQAKTLPTKIEYKNKSESKCDFVSVVPLFHNHNWRHVRNSYIMFITIEHIKNIGISKFENTQRLLVQVRNLFINFELKVST